MVYGYAAGVSNLRSSEVFHPARDHFIILNISIGMNINENVILIRMTKYKLQNIRCYILEYLIKINWCEIWACLTCNLSIFRVKY